MKWIGASLAAVVMSTQAAPALEISRAVAAGHKLELFHLTSVHPDCTSIGYAEVRLVQAAAHGRLQQSRGTAFPTYRIDNPRYVCNTRRVAALNIDYKPDPGFLGVDRFTVEIIFPDGEDRVHTVNVYVR